MTTFALNNLWTYLQGLSLSQSDCEWLASKLIMPKKGMTDEREKGLTAEERKAKFLSMAGIWSESEEGEEYYQMMKHRNDDRPLNREINLDDQYTMEGYILDTDTWIEYFHHRGGVDKHIAGTPAEQIFASEVSIAELTFGALNSNAVDDTTDG